MEAPDGHLREEAEKRLALSRVTTLAIEGKTVEEIVHELEVHQIELEMQNEELRRAQGEIEASRARYFDLFHLAPVGYLTLNSKGFIVEVNLAAATMLGMERSHLAKKPFTQYIIPEDQDIYYLHQKKLLETGTPQVCEVRMKHADGAIFWARIQGTMAMDHTRTLVHRVTLSDITDRKTADDKIKALLSEKELLLREVHHRIKNNMNVLVSLLSLHARTLKEPSAVSALNDAGSRVRSMMVLYDKLYRSAEPLMDPCTNVTGGGLQYRTISVKEYLTALIDEIIAIFPNRGLVTIETQIDEAFLDTKTLFPLGMILNELLTNTMKHAFTGKDRGAVRVSLSIRGTHATLCIEDDGSGIPPSIDIEASPGFGLHLVEMLTGQIGGTIRLERQEGTRFILEFEK